VQLLDRNGELLYEFLGGSAGFRVPVPLEEISPNLINATLAAEDADFYTNPGVSWRGLSRAIYENLAFWEYGGFFNGTGGSSITQQVVKNMQVFGEPTRSPVRKVREIFAALALNRMYPKDEILSWYLNSIFYGSGAYGAEAASQRYFGKPASELTVAEAAMLAGIPNAPSTYNVFEDMEAVKGRQGDVLSLMAYHGFISPQEAADAFAEPLKIKSATFEMKAPHFDMYVQGLLPKLVGDAATEGGLKVTTTLDLRLQRAAEKAIEDHLSKLGGVIGRADSALVAIDPQTGEILAMVGGRSFFDDPVAGQVNNATALNQPGSAMKPITYLAAFQKGWNPATVVADEPIQLDNGGRKYTLQNFDGKYAGKVTAREALGNSLNVPAVHALEYAGLQKVHDLSAKMGLTTLKDASSYGPAFTLGGADITVLDLTYVFSVFAGGGEQHGMRSIVDAGDPRRPLDPTAVLKIEDAQGKTIWQFHPQGERIVPEPYAYLITNVLSDNGARLRTFGANNPLVLPGRPAAAKTGLTDDPRDAWTLGYTPQLAAGVWVGYKDNRPMPGASSSAVASPIWHAFMEEALKDQPAVEFAVPQGVQFVDICKSTGHPPLGGPCRESVREVFVAGQVPPPQREPTPTPTVTPTPQPSPSPFPTATPGASASAQAQQAGQTRTPTARPTVTATAEVAASTAPPRPTATARPASTATPAPTATAPPAATPRPTSSGPDRGGGRD
jgi:membrane peptidoglycan carboxypeptidase